MGTDIHLHVERLNPAGAWDFVPPPDKYPCAWCFGEGKHPHRQEPCNCRGTGTARPRSFYSERNYHAFAVLADVRNGTGFAGVKTGSGFVTIDEALTGIPGPKGPGIKTVPAEDMDRYIKAGKPDLGTVDTHFGPRPRLIYARIEWQQTYRDAIGPRFFEAMHRLRDYGPPDQVRVVFGFDS